MRRVFISHRSGDAQVRALIDQINNSLTASGFDVLVDFERLNPGARWRDDIYTWMGVCHAAVALISQDTLAQDSVWVPRECSILAWRKTLDPTFTLIPVLLPGVTTDQLRIDLRFRDLGLHDLQIIAHSDGAATCSAILAGMQHLTPAPSSPLEELAEQVEILLGGVRGDFIDEAIRLIGADAGGVPRVNGSARRLALALLQMPLGETMLALEYLAPRVPSAAAVDRILDLIAPGWVDLSAARWIAYCAASPDPRPAAVVNVHTRFAAEMYVRRASCRPPKTTWRVVSITAVHGEQVFEDFAAEIDAALRAEFSTCLINDPFGAAPSAELYQLLHELNRRGRPVVLVLRLPVGAAEFLPQLQERFPHLTFLFLSGDSLPDAATCPETLLRRIEPALASGREDTAMSDYRTARTLLRAGVETR
jgi:hypothetical protein